MRAPKLGVLLVAALFSACGGGSPTEDAGPSAPDTGERDGGAADSGALPDGGGDAPSPADAAVLLDTPSLSSPYVVEDRSIEAGGETRSFVLARPEPYPSGSALPLVFSLHGDGGSGAGMRAALPLEAAAGGAAVFVYPNAPGGSFEYWTDAGRTREAAFVTATIAALVAELGIHTQRVFIAGFSGGATMANALGCRLGPAVVRAVGLHSGTLYPVTDAGGAPDFAYTGGGGVSCALPAAVFVWGVADATPGVSFADGESVRDNYRATQSCEAATSPSSPSPCVAYDFCAAPLIWCPIEGMGHRIWSGAADAMWRLFDSLGAP